MPLPVEIVFEGMDSSDAVCRRVEEEAAKLERFHDRVTSARAVVKAPAHHQHKGGLFEVKVHLLLPGGGYVVADRNPPHDHGHEDVYVAIRDAFDAARRQLQDFVRIREGKVKTHQAPGASEG